MASAGAGGSMPPNFILTPQQQNLLFAALNSNKPTANTNSGNPLSISPVTFPSPQMNKPDSANGFQDSPFLDNYDYDFGDSSFDFSFASTNGDQPRMIGDVPGTSSSGSPEKDSPDNETSEKRSHPDDDDEDGAGGNDPKRQDKVPKKPGRKPLTSEPSSRKAQNRAAQRAFRERKEKHLKDLETKVEELQKESDAANNANTLLRAQVERMTAELAQYKQKMSLLTSPNKPLSRDKIHPFGNAAVNNLSDVSFQFEFPKFGMLPGPKASSPQPTVSPRQKTQSASPSASIDNQSPRTAHRSMGDAQFSEELAKFSSVFTPSMSSSATNASRASLDSANVSMGGANTSSPSASSHSHGGPSSSCGTSPEPFTQSPMGTKPVETLTTIGEEQPSMSTIDQPFSQYVDLDASSSNLDWLSQQNTGFEFDPQLFGNYRETQDNILSNPSFDELFNDTPDADFYTPYNLPAATTGAPKKNLIEQIDAQQDSLDDELPKKANMNCSQIWYGQPHMISAQNRSPNKVNRDKLQTLPKAQNGEFDLDGLCSELTKKAKCSGSGPVVGEQDFDTILKKYMGKDVSSNTLASSLGIEVNSDKQSLGLSLP
ncbi:transcription factor PAP1-domain-containing protein [Stachybotrys elegans]|uniref:Transcription factor PAP1-domain-containing protein n=1 Tax=Stachybotrys elegans TaxID=80388 RepID=A0A8K0SMF9_9HYPO|nr:transcription factor PAP1-domain-containing protein [Stachybotrys elegans]